MILKNSSFLRYCVIGVINTVSCFAIIFLLMDVFKVDYRVSNIVGYAIGLVISFTLNKYRNFRSYGHIGREIMLFLMAFGIAYTVNFEVLILTVETMGFDEFYAQIISGGCYTMIFYVFMKFIVFQKKGSSLLSLFCRE